MSLAPRGSSPPLLLPPLLPREEERPPPSSIGRGCPLPEARPQLLWADRLSRLSPGATLYGRLKEYLLTEDQLKENGFPFPHPERPGGAVIFTAEEKKPKDCELLPPGEGHLDRGNSMGERVQTQRGVGPGTGLTPPSSSPPPVRPHSLL